MAVILPNGTSCLQNVKILQNLGERVQPEYPETPESYPHTTKNEGDKGWRNGEEVYHGVKLEHEDQLVVGCYEPHEEVGHEENIQDEIKLENTFSLLID